MAYVLVYVINGTCAVFANGELMHTTLCTSEGHSSTKSSDCILLYISCSKDAVTTPSLYGLLASRHIFMERVNVLIFSMPNRYQTAQGRGLYFSARCRFVSIFPLVTLSSLVDVRRKYIRTNSGGFDMTGL